MKKTKNTLILTLLFTWTLTGFSQQEPQYSNYQMNNFMLNPAVAGSYGFNNAKMGMRYQWVGMEGSPTTVFATYHAPIHHPGANPHIKRKMPHHGVGLQLFSDRTFAMSYNGFMATYAIHKKLDKHWTISLGGSFGAKQFRVDESKFFFTQTTNDPDVGNRVLNRIMPDLNLGAWLYSKKAFFGLSARQLLGGDLSFNNLETINSAKLYNHYFMTAGVLLPMSSSVEFIPSIMVQAVNPAPVQVDVNGTFWYNKQFAVGYSYRHLDALYILFDYVYENKYEVGYAFDLTLSELTKHNIGTHEIIVGIRWGDHSHDVYCPGKFW